MNPNAKACVLITLTLMLIFCSLAWADESNLVWSTFLGGESVDEGHDIVVDDLECSYIVGVTWSYNFPTTAGAFDRTYNEDYDAFVTKLDPIGSSLVYSTFLGGTDEEGGYGIALDEAGNAYVTGITKSDDFPVTVGAYDVTYNGGESPYEGDVFVAKLDFTGSGLIYSTFLGGDDPDEGRSIAVNNLGNAHVTGYTKSLDFPTSAGAFDTTYNPSRSVFVTVFNSMGNALVYSTFIGGSWADWGNGIAIDSDGEIYVTGKTGSEDFPTTVGAFDTTMNGAYDVFIAKLSSMGNSLVYSTFIGGGDSDWGENITVDGSDAVHLVGSTESRFFPVTPGAFDTTFDNYSSFPPSEAFVLKLNPSGSALEYATFLGGSGDDEGLGIGLDSYDCAYVTGYTHSNNFPTTPDAFDSTVSSDDVFVTKFNQNGSALEYSTLLGGNSSDVGYGIAVNDAGNAFVTGYTKSLYYPTTAGAFDQTYNDSKDAFVAKFNIGSGDSSAPEAIDNLIAMIENGVKSYWGNVHLSWSEPYDDVGVEYYVISRSSTPGLFSDSLAMTAETTYLDIGAVGNPSTNYFYTVTAIDAAKNKSPASNQVGEFDKPWIVGKGD